VALRDLERAQRSSVGSWIDRRLGMRATTVWGSRSSELTFTDRGEHELKGIPDRWVLYMVAA